MIGRDSRTLLELFKYIVDSPEESNRLLEKLNFAEPNKQKLIEGLVF